MTGSLTAPAAYRIVGDSGETYYVTTTIRAYNAVLDRWELIGMDSGNGLQDFGTAQKTGTEMHIEQRFGVMSPTPPRSLGALTPPQK
jgi:hypothetical protein